MNSKQNKINKNKLLTGFTILEVIIAISLLLFSIMGALSFFAPAIKLTGNFSYHAVADYLAQEGLEVVKNIRDNNIIQGISWSSGLSGCKNGCQLDYKTGTAVQTQDNALQAYTGNPLNLNSEWFYSYDAGVATKFKRKITITKPFLSNNDILKVDVLLMWDYDGKPFNFNTIGYIYSL